jgi:hypothetical protein
LHPEFPLQVLLHIFFKDLALLAFCTQPLGMIIAKIYLRIKTDMNLIILDAMDYIETATSQIA